MLNNHRQNSKEYRLKNQIPFFEGTTINRFLRTLLEKLYGHMYVQFKNFLPVGTQYIYFCILLFSSNRILEAFHIYLH